ncbi:hypothetical protein Tco_1294817 [Tanacetum coccineum]
MFGKGRRKFLLLMKDSYLPVFSTEKLRTKQICRMDNFAIRYYKSACSMVIKFRRWRFKACAFGTLPDTWETFRTSLSNSAPDGVITMELAKGSILNEERRKSQGSSSHSDVLVTERQGRSKSRGPSNRGNHRSSSSKGKFADKNKHKKDDDGDDSTEVNTTTDSTFVCSDYDMVNLAHDDSSWILDSGATRHVATRKEYFSSYTPGDFGVVRMGLLDEDGLPQQFFFLFGSQKTETLCGRLQYLSLSSMIIHGRISRVLGNSAAKDSTKTPQLKVLAERIIEPCFRESDVLLSHAWLAASFGVRPLNTAYMFIEFNPLRFLSVVDVPDRIPVLQNIFDAQLGEYIQNDEEHGADDVDAQEQPNLDEDVHPELPVPMPPFIPLRRSTRDHHPSTRYSANEYVLLTDGGEPECYAEAMEDDTRKNGLMPCKNEMKSFQKKGLDFDEIFSSSREDGILFELFLGLAALALDLIRWSKWMSRHDFLHGIRIKKSILNNLRWLQEVEVIYREASFRKTYSDHVFSSERLGPAKQILGIRIFRDRGAKKLHISQEQYIEKVLRRFNMDKAKVVSSPLTPNFKLTDKDCPSSKKNIEKMDRVSYASAVGSLMYAMRGTSKLGITFGNGKPMLVGYTDSNLAGNKDNMKSTSGYLMTFAGGAVSWQSRLQKCVALSTTEAEYVAATEACKELLWLKKFLQELGFKQQRYAVLYDNQSQNDTSQGTIGADGQVFIFDNDTVRLDFTKFVIQQALPFNHFDNVKLTEIIKRGYYRVLNSPILEDVEETIAREEVELGISPPNTELDEGEHGFYCNVSPGASVVKSEKRERLSEEAKRSDLKRFDTKEARRKEKIRAYMEDKQKKKVYYDTPMDHENLIEIDDDDDEDTNEQETD